MASSCDSGLLDIGLAASQLEIRTQPREMSPACRRLLQPVATEFRAIAQMLLVTASIVNSIKDGRFEGNSSALKVFLPAKPKFFPKVEIEFAATEPLSHLGYLIQIFYLRLQTARLITKSFSRDSEDIAVKGHVHFDTIVDTWTDLCADALVILSVISTVATQGVTGSSEFSQDPLKRLLALTERGRAPCVRADGSIEVPSVAERRKHKRYPVAWPASLESDGVFQSLTIGDLSTGGITMLGACDLKPSTQVRIELASGRILVGRIVWYDAGRAGLAFNSPLAIDDPLIAAAIAESKVREATVNCASAQQFQTPSEVTLISTLDFDYLLGPAS